MIMYEREKQASKRAKYCRKKHNWNKLYKQNWNLMIKNTKHTKKNSELPSQGKQTTLNKVTGNEIKLWTGYNIFH